MKVRRDEEDVDVDVGKGVTLQLTIRDGEVFFHGLGIGNRNNLGVGFDEGLDGYALPECEFTEWLLTGDSS